MKTLMTKILMAMALLAAAASCTTTDGDIGALRGLWKVAEIDCNGTALSDYEGNGFMAFENNVVALRMVYDHNQTDSKYGVWSDDGNGTLTISFPDTNYEPFDVFHFSQESNLLRYTKIDRGGFTLTAEAADGNTYVYHLEYW